MTEEWGPWIEHGLQGLPVSIGTIVERQFDQMPTHSYFANTGFTDVRGIIGPVIAEESPNWSVFPTRVGVFDVPKVIRYRIRKPSGLTILEEIARNILAPKRAREGA